MRGDPEREAKMWLDRIAEADSQRTRAQNLAIEGLLSSDELREKLAHLAEQRRTAERELETLRARTERLANLELEAEALLAHYAGMAREGLEAYAPEDRHDAYQALRLRVVVHPDGRMEAGACSSRGRGCVVLNQYVCSSRSPPEPSLVPGEGREATRGLSGEAGHHVLDAGVVLEAVH